MEKTSTNQHGPNTIVSRILQVALGLFVTTTDLPPLPLSHEILSYDCSFDTDCRWSSVGETMDRWRIAKGEPDSLLWLAATGTMQLPREPFVLIEQRGNPVDALMTDAIKCQRGYADLSFTYWAIGSADLEICLTDLNNEKFNCTGMLDSNVMPGKVLLRIPEMQQPFRIMISPNNLPGVLIIDDIKYDASTCETGTPLPNLHGRPDMSTTPSTLRTFPWTRKETIISTTSTITMPSTTTSASPVIVEIIDELRSTSSEFSGKTLKPNIESDKNGSTRFLPSNTTDIPFDLMIYGNKTTPLFDRRTGTIVSESTKLLCDFNNEFSCQWGAEAGRWAIMQRGAIPSLDDSVTDASLLPSYPAALVLQGAAMLTSDPIRCQTGSGKMLFRYWSNGGIVLQVCALGYGVDSTIIECVDQSNTLKHERNTLAVFNMNRSIAEPFTLNIVPQWEPGLKNRFLVIDEIAYIGECTIGKKDIHGTTTHHSISVPMNITTGEPLTTTTITTWIVPSESEIGKPTPKIITLPPTTKQQTKESYTHKKSYTRPSNNGWTMPILTTTEDSIKLEDYCDLLNCNFDDNACNYMNHGLTKKPWTLRTRAYGFPLKGNADIETTTSNGQFISTILDPGDVAILESPKFNATRSLNVLLFQYYRPKQMSTIRLCLGSRYMNPLRNVSSFIQCPSIIRSVTTKNAYRWNTVHVQIPPGTTHFFLVAHSSERLESRTAMAIDNMRVAICDSRGFAPEYAEDVNYPQQFVEYEYKIDNNRNS